MILEHSFDTDLAAEIGMKEAVIFKNLSFWILKNEANQRHFYDGNTWTYNSVKAFSEIFYYMSPKEIRNALAKLESCGLIISGNYNSMKTDRTKWYALTEEGKSICLKGKNHLPKKEKGFAPEGEAIPDNNTNNNTINKPNTKKEDDENQDVILSFQGLRGHDLQVAADNGFTNDNDLLNAYIDFYKMRKSIKKPLTDRAVVMLKDQLDKLANGDIQMMIDILNQSSFNCWQGVFPLKCNVKYSQSQKAVNGDTGSYDAYGNMRQ